INQSSVNITSTETEKSNDDIASNISDNASNSDISEQVENIVSQSKDAPASEDEKMDAFLNEVHKKKVNDAIKQRNWEKKLQAQESHPEKKMPQELNSVIQPCNNLTPEVSENVDLGSLKCPTSDAVIYDQKRVAGENDKDSKLSEVEINTSTKSIPTDSEKLPNTEASVPSPSYVNISNKFRPSISVLPDDLKEKKKHVIKMALEQFPILSLKYSNESGDYFNSSVSCSLCNKDHKKENIRDNIKGE
ncbi:7008_t:CDS:2, partial [Ambispora gerdemannii]